MEANEKNVSAQQCPPQTDTRFSQTHEHHRRSCRAQTPTGQRPETSRRHCPSQASTPVNPAPPVLTFPKEARILARREFLLLQQRGKKRHGQYFLVITAPGRTERSRLGITTSRRFGKSVDRNRMKRLLREFFRERQRALVPAVDIVIIPKAGAHELSLLQVDAELERLLSLAKRTS